ncbi:MAG: creatininase family protein [Pseudomonadota bacterium]
MRLDHVTWLEVEEHIRQLPVIILPTGSTEQHGPMGMIGTDSICAETIAEKVAENVNCLVAPTLCYTPAEFNMAFPGTMSISADLLEQVFAQIVDGLSRHHFKLIYVLNGHGANLEPMQKVSRETENTKIRIRSWWDFEPVNELRRKWYGDWEGMHATPSEVSITQATHRIIPPGDAATPPEKLSQEFIKDHAGDRHGSPHEHRKQFPDGRVGSHSALAKPDHGEQLLNAAVEAVTEDLKTAYSNI